jgi:hypothetical protein
MRDSFYGIPLQKNLSFNLAYDYMHLQLLPVNPKKIVFMALSHFFAAQTWGGFKVAPIPWLFVLRAGRKLNFSSSSICLFFSQVAFEEIISTSWIPELFVEIHNQTVHSYFHSWGWWHSVFRPFSRNLHL